MNAKPTALDAYLARVAAIHAKLQRLQQLADDHFGHDPDAIHWGHVVQLETCRNPKFGACLLVVTNPRPWGGQGYIQAIGSGDQPCGLTYYRARREEMEFVGAAEWFADSMAGESDEY